MSRCGRREMLCRVATGAGLAGIGRWTLAADAAPQRITLGFSLYGMKAMTTEQAVQELHRIGYDTVELCLFDGFDAEPRSLTHAKRDRLRQVLDGVSMSVSALMENLQVATKDADSA